MFHNEHTIRRKRQRSSFHFENGKRMSNDLHFILLQNYPTLKRSSLQDVLDDKSCVVATALSVCCASPFFRQQAIWVVFQKYSSGCVTPVLQFLPRFLFKASIVSSGTQGLCLWPLLHQSCTLFWPHWFICSFWKHLGSYLGLTRLVSSLPLRAITRSYLCFFSA